MIGRADDSEFRTEHAVLMSTNDDREELVRLVTYLMSGEGSEEEQAEALRKLEARVLHPRVSDLIFWPRHEGFDRELTPDEVVDVDRLRCTVCYTPKQRGMKIDEVAPDSGLYVLSYGKAIEATATVHLLKPFPALRRSDDFDRRFDPARDLS